MMGRRVHAVVMRALAYRAFDFWNISIQTP
jgi:hypothetical protein